MPEQGQYVNYTAQGICRVEGIESLKFGDGKARDYYLLRPVNQPESSVYLPVDNPDLLAKLHPILSKEEIDQIILSVRQDSIPWVSDFREREEQFSAILARRDERELLLLIGCLLLREEEGTHRLSSGDQQTLRKAQRIVAEEFSFSLHLPADQIDDYIREKLNITRQG